MRSSHARQLINDTFDAYRTVFASAWIGDAVLAQLEGLNPRSVREWILSAAGQPSAEALVGPLFQSFAHRALCAGGAFATRPLTGTGGEGSLLLPARTRLSYVDASELDSLRPCQYAVPAAPGRAAGDALALHSADTLLIFQCTVGVRHALVAPALEELIARFPSLPAVRVYFVVPHPVYPAWRALQPYAADCSGAPCVRLPECLATVTQHVLCVSLE